MIRMRRVTVLPAGVMDVRVRAPAAAALPWYLAGGIPAANCIAAYQAKGAVSLATSYVNLANPGTYDLTLGTAPVWDATNGWQFNGSTGKRYLITGLTHASGWSLALQFTGSAAPPSYTFALGAQATGNTKLYIAPQRGATSAYSVGNGGGANGAPTITAGNFIVTPNTPMHNVWKDGVDQNITITAWSGTNTAAAIIGGLNNNGVNGEWYTGNISACAWYDIDISSYAAALAAAMAAL